jgi:hypothetical protein
MVRAIRSSNAPEYKAILPANEQPLIASRVVSIPTSGC